MLYEIVFARIKEIYEIILFQNINFKSFNKTSNKIFLEINHKTQLKCFNEIYQTLFLENGNPNFHFVENICNERMLETANKLVHFGWKKEAIPVAESQKTLIARFFDAIFS